MTADAHGDLPDDLMARVRAAPAFEIVAKYEQVRRCPNDDCPRYGSTEFVRVDGVRRCRYCGCAIDEPDEDGCRPEEDWSDILDGFVREVEEPVEQPPMEDEA